MRVFGGHTVILAYHRIARETRDPHLLCVDPDVFADQIDHLRRHVDIVPLAGLNQRSPRQRVVLTFDDGYADNAGVAKSILDGMGVPATFFVTAGMVGADRGFWWDRLEALVLSSSLDREYLEVELDGRTATLDVRSDQARLLAHGTLHARLRQLPVREIDRLLDDLMNELNIPTVDRETHRVMSEQELLSLSTSDLFEVGAHTVSHPLLSAQPLEEQRREISASRSILEELTGLRVRAFSYPFGGRDAFSRATIGLVERAGYIFACTGLSGPVSRRLPLLRFPLLRLPRNFVRNWHKVEFANWLSRCFAREQ
jgi:peptidoglycan/xylan/chitin deacetylase (PgdA/CDA1 family)